MYEDGNFQGNLKEEEEEEEKEEEEVEPVDDDVVVLTTNVEGNANNNDYSVAVAVIGIPVVMGNNSDGHIPPDVESQNDNQFFNQPTPSQGGYDKNENFMDAEVLRNENLNFDEMEEWFRLLGVQKDQNQQKASTSDDMGISIISGKPRQKGWCRSKRQNVIFACLICIAIISVMVRVIETEIAFTPPPPPSSAITTGRTTPIPTTPISTTPERTTPLPTTPTLITPGPKTQMPTTTEQPVAKPKFPLLTETTWVQVGNNIDGLNIGDRSGSSVSISTLGNIVVGGAPAMLTNRPGSARVYTYDSSSHEWNLIDQLLNSGSTTNEEDWFGSTVSTSNDGKIIAIGAPLANNKKGSLYIYKLNIITNTIELIQELTGGYVDISGDGSNIIVGADSIDNEYVKVYHKDVDNDYDWSQLGNTIVGPSSNGETLRDGFGAIVSISNDGNIVAVGAPQLRTGSPGYVNIYQYDKSSNRWIDYGNNNDNILVGDGSDDAYGSAISLSSSGNIVAIGAPWNYGINNNKKKCGTVKIFKLNSNTNNWYQLGSNIDGENEGDWSGHYQGVKLSDNGMIVAIGSPFNDGINGYSSGSVRIFEYDSPNNQWIQISQNIDGEKKLDFSGISISLSGDGSIVAIGSCGNDDNGENSGHVRVYRRGDDDDDDE